VAGRRYFGAAGFVSASRMRKRNGSTSYPLITPLSSTSVPAGGAPRGFFKVTCTSAVLAA